MGYNLVGGGGGAVSEAAGRVFYLKSFILVTVFNITNITL